MPVIISEVPHNQSYDEHCVTARSYKFWVVLGVEVVAVLASRSRRAAAQPLTQNEYVDAQTCAQCHAGIVRAYSNIGMARAFHSDLRLKTFKQGALGWICNREQRFRHRIRPHRATLAELRLTGECLTKGGHLTSCARCSRSGLCSEVEAGICDCEKPQGF
jgi:hypothetical protein